MCSPKLNLMAVKRRVGRAVAKPTINFLILEMGGECNEVPTHPTLLSSGEKQLILILLETFLAKESCILIDEPEISMHINWQERLINAMQQLNPSVQIILTTHTPEIMVNIEDDRIFRL
jgi:ABC-type lipoprotein export system ATPase subunit